MTTLWHVNSMSISVQLCNIQVVNQVTFRSFLLGNVWQRFPKGFRWNVVFLVFVDFGGFFFVVCSLIFIFKHKGESMYSFFLRCALGDTCWRLSLPSTLNIIFSPLPSMLINTKSGKTFFFATQNQHKTNARNFHQIDNDLMNM